MNTEYMLLGLYNKPRLSLQEVCHALGMAYQTGVNQRSTGKFPIPMTGSPLGADVREVAAYLDKLRQEARDQTA